jgi:RNA polymerase sigma-70 factor, ECF subfamily
VAEAPAAPADLEALWRAGAGRWPEVALEWARFAELVGPALAAGAAAADPGELYLACAWSDGVAEAIRAFDRHYLPPLRARLARMGLPEPQLDEVAQRVRTRLLRREPGGAAALLGYAGRGRLRSFVAVVGTRIALDELRGAARAVTDAEALLELAGPADPRAQVMRRQFQEVLRAAFEEAAVALSPRERTVLRLHLLDGLLVEEIATFYRVHRVTVSRWLAAARRQLETGIRRVARERFGMSEGDFTAAFTASQLSLSLDRLLAE